jgi:hypothetical protein
LHFFILLYNFGLNFNLIYNAFFIVKFSNFILFLI